MWIVVVIRCPMSAEPTYSFRKCCLYFRNIVKTFHSSNNIIVFFLPISKVWLYSAQTSCSENITCARTIHVLHFVLLSASLTISINGADMRVENFSKRNRLTFSFNLSWISSMMDFTNRSYRLIFPIYLLVETIHTLKFFIVLKISYAIQYCHVFCIMGTFPDEFDDIRHMTLLSVRKYEC